MTLVEGKKVVEEETRQLVPGWLRQIGYRLGQAGQQFGFVKALSESEQEEVGRALPARAWSLFQTMSAADQRHSLRVYRGLRARGCVESDLLAAALLHDVGKAEGRVPFWTRPVIVVGKRIAPRQLKRLAVYPRPQTVRWRRALGYAWWHAEVGAELAGPTGLSERALLYIRTHHQPDGPAAELHVVDEAS